MANPCFFGEKWRQNDELAGVSRSVPLLAISEEYFRYYAIYLSYDRQYYSIQQLLYRNKEAKEKQQPRRKEAVMTLLAILENIVAAGVVVIAVVTLLERVVKH